VSRSVKRLGQPAADVFLAPQFSIFAYLRRTIFRKSEIFHSEFTPAAWSAHILKPNSNKGLRHSTRSDRSRRGVGEQSGMADIWFAQIARGLDPNQLRGNYSVYVRYRT
jgi:hypothetical protein